MASRIAMAVRLPLHLQQRLSPTHFSNALTSLHHSNHRTTFTYATPNSIQSNYDSIGQQEIRHTNFHTSQQAPFQTHSSDHSLTSSNSSSSLEPVEPGSIAFGECEIAALSDLFLQFAKTGSNEDSNNPPTPYLNIQRIKLLLESIGEKPDEQTLLSLMDEVNTTHDGKLRLDCFLRAADRILGKAPARVVLVVGGPGSGKGALCQRLAADCSAVHLSCGEMLREEVEAQTPLGKEVEAIMARGDLVSSALVTALMRRRMRKYPGRRILLDGFPRSLENARDFVELCGPPELALHLDCDDTILIERILARGGKSAKDAERAAAEGKVVNVRSDDNVHTAIQRLKNYHKHHHSTMSWLKEIRVPIVELDCSGSKEDVWQQLMAIGRLMRPAVKLPQQATDVVSAQPQQQQLQQQPASQQRVDKMAVNGSNIGQPQEVNEDLQWIA